MMESTWTLRRATPSEEPRICRITIADVPDALRLGWRDFQANPTQLIFLAILYPVVGLVAARAMSGGRVMPLVWPLASGFALVGPIAALGIYELSRRHERGLDVSWRHALDVRHNPALGSILLLGLMLLAIFAAWLMMAEQIYQATVGTLPSRPADLAGLLRTVFSTPEGWWLLLLGNGVGFLFAALVLCLTVVSFPLLLDRGAEGRAIDAGTALRASLRAVVANPVPMALWGVMVAGLLALGSLPLFVGLAVVLPVLGHATWHLYRKVVVR
ncbi:DUF2189 domain-containing protein [Teichococcus oryzae]|uniref:DUF2189 domain-containing protein n=1 Tax=Teichococcus oryzae TaxID=1608942 RepID=A0A5B2TJJ6_9PROT|nr:DUF2189 domain-containing protein [Pseudoroseomonas oryzae]KAA2214687.1 DUF2189 domain-containing protein [Pseudoroseomonas oryzae]